MEWLDNVTYWQWWVAALILVIFEVFSPGAFFLWLGVAAGVVGLVLLAVPDLGWEAQFLMFAIFSVASIVLWHRVLKRRPIETDQPRLNRRGEQYVDRVFTLEEPIVNGHGKIKVDDSTWKITGSDCAAGTRVKVIGVDGVVLNVEVV
ncbi:MAG: NfeD family protein [Chromatiales bacterium]|nr:NfeD family protein [Chromatiales bacterium]